MAHTPASYHAPALHYRAKGICSCNHETTGPAILPYALLTIFLASRRARTRMRLAGYTHIVPARCLIVVTKP
jgi:hypothetical protein